MIYEPWLSPYKGSLPFISYHLHKKQQTHNKEQNIAYHFLTLQRINNNIPALTKYNVLKNRFLHF